MPGDSQYIGIFNQYSIFVYLRSTKCSHERLKKNTSIVMILMN